MNEVLLSGFLPAPLKLAQIIAIISTGIILGAVPAGSFRRIILVAATAYMAGVAGALLAGAGYGILPLLFAICATISLAGVLAVRRRWLALPIAIAGGAAIGAASVPLGGTLDDTIHLLVTNAVGVALLFPAIWCAGAWLYRPAGPVWLDIGVRICLAWIFAIALIMLAFTVV